MGPPVAGAAEVRDDHDHRPAAGQPAEAGDCRAERGRSRGLEVGLPSQGEQEREQAAVPLPGRGRDRVTVAERGHGEPVAAAHGEVAECERDAFCDVPLAPVGRPEGHRRGRVEQQPGLDRPLGDVDADVRLAGPGGDVPVDPANVVSEHVRPHLGELGAVAERPGAVIAGEQPVDPPAHGQVDLAQQRRGHRPRARAARRPLRSEGGDGAHATSWRVSCGIAIVSSTRSST